MQIPSHFKFVHEADRDTVYTACRASFNYYAAMWIDEETQEMACVLYSIREVADCVNEGTWMIVKVIQ